MTNYAVTEEKTAWLKYDFGNELARKWFGDEAIDALPKFVRGKNKGKTKGVLVWTKCTKGGWVRGSHGSGGVAFPNRCYGHCIKEDTYSKRDLLGFRDTLKYRAKQDEADSKRRSELQEKIDSTQEKIGQAKKAIAQYREVENDPNVSDSLKEELAFEASRAEILLECNTEHLEYLRTGYFK